MPIGAVAKAVPAAVDAALRRAASLLAAGAAAPCGHTLLVGRSSRLAIAAAAIAAIGACSDDGAVAAAGSDATSVDGLAIDAAVTAGCPKGAAGCKGGVRWVCNDQGTGFVETPCPAKTVCSDGLCVACATDGDCPAGAPCTQGSCQVAPLAIVTTALPPALVGKPYAAKLEAKGGVQPHTWSIGQGALAAGLQLQPSGAIDGAAQAAGAFSFQVKVGDPAGSAATQVLALEVKDSGLVVTSPSPLPAATEGEPYKYALAAQGGVPPYFWGVKGGALPAGVALTGDGTLAGTPASDGDHAFEVKVFDNGEPPLVGSRALVLPVKLAPLEIVGSQEVNLFITKLIVLPLIVVVDKLPVPYSAKLQAKGGKKPYAWAETPLPGMIKGFLPKAGIPAGLKLGADGTLSGAVSDPALVTEVKVPLSQIVLKGFFFAAEVSDSQAKPQKKQAIFIIPTVPVGGP